MGINFINKVEFFGKLTEKNITINICLTVHLSVLSN